MSRWSVRKDFKPGRLGPDALFWDGAVQQMLTTEQADEMQRLIDLDAPSGLPEGVHAAPDGTLLCRGKDLPPGPWERNLIGRLSREWFSNADFAAAGDVDRECQDRWYEVRPVAPEPERVPWWEAAGRTLLLDGEPVKVTGVGCNDGGLPYFKYGVSRFQVFPEFHAGATPTLGDGMVAVLPLDGDQ